ncbi:MAG: M56 family metallopeptidase [Acidimicrobiales bacterium]
MSGAAAGVALLALLAVLPGLVGTRTGASPRVAAGTHLVSLAGWGLLPTVWLACLGGAIGSWVAGIRVSGGGCLFGLDGGDWQLLGYVPAAATVGVLAWQALRLAVAARRAELRGLALAGSVRQAVGGGCVWVVPSSQQAAYAGGLWRPRAVVTSGLLGPLDEAERRAVCVHEAAHVRLGHPRILLAGGAVTAAYGLFPPVRRAWDSLRRDLEAAADDEAVRAVGAGPVLSALARVALLAAGGERATVAFGDPQHLRYRITRLQLPRPVRHGPTATVGSLAVMLTGMMAWSACILAGAHATTAGVTACLAVLAAVGLRPTWTWGHRRVGKSLVVPPGS